MNPAESRAIQEMLQAMVEGLVDDPSAFAIETAVNDDLTTFRVQVKAHEIGRIIGSNGRTARALRVILSAVATKLKVRVALDITQDQ